MGLARSTLLTVFFTKQLRILNTAMEMLTSSKQGDDFFEPSLINWSENVSHLTVHIQDSPSLPFFIDQGKDDLGIGAAVAGDMIRKFMNIRDDDWFFFKNTGPADPFSPLEDLTG
jgi:hypothetical protein